jgi:hypothetical protein
LSVLENRDSYCQKLHEKPIGRANLIQADLLKDKICINPLQADQSGDEKEMV